MNKKDIEAFVQKEIKKREMFISHMIFARLDQHDRLKCIGGCSRK